MSTSSRKCDNLQRWTTTVCLQVFAANRSTRQTAPNTKASCIAKSATAANSALRATASVVELVACPWTKAIIFKRRTSECICRRTTSIPIPSSSLIPEYQRGPTSGASLLFYPLHVKTSFTCAKLKIDRPTVVNARDPSA